MDIAGPSGLVPRVPAPGSIKTSSVSVRSGKDRGNAVLLDLEEVWLTPRIQRGRPVWTESTRQEGCESIPSDGLLAGGARRFVGRARGSDGLGRRRRATLLPSGPAATYLAGTAGRGARDRMNDRGRCTEVSVKAENDVRKAGAEAEARWLNRGEVAGHRGSWP